MAEHPTTSQAAPARSFLKLVEWMLQATRHAFDQAQPQPDDRLLLDAADGWTIGFVGKLELIRTEAGNRIRATFAKPRGEGPTTRDFDPASCAMLMALCVPGGRLALEPHGPKGDYYLLRLIIRGRRPDGQLRRVYALRIPADTPPDRKTREPENFRSALRRDLGIFFRDADPTGSGTQYGIEDAKQDSVARWQELATESPAVLPLAVDADAFANILFVFHRLLNQVPLGTEQAA